jgi:hypothetical protein
MSENHDITADIQELQFAAELCRANALTNKRIWNAERAAFWNRRADEYDAEVKKLQALIKQGEAK